MLVRNARRSALPEAPRAPSARAITTVSDAQNDGLCDAAAPVSNEPLDDENDGEEDGETDDDVADLDAPQGARGTQRRSTSAFGRTIGLVLSATYLTATYGGAPAVYSLRLGEKCTSTVVVHLQAAGDAGSADGVLRLSCDRLEFTARNFAEPQIVRVELVEPSGGSHLVLHRVFSLDKNYDRLVAPTVVVKTERSSLGSLLLLGGALVHKRKNAKGEIMAPRLAANRTIDVGRALAAAATTAAVAAAAAATVSAGGDGSTSFSFAASPPGQQPLESSPVFVSHMAAGHSFSSIVLKPQGGAETLLVWGMNNSGELGIGSTTPMVEPVPLVLPPQLHGEPVSVVSMACGKHHAALVTTHGRLYTWGNNKHGQLGLGDYTNVDSPREVVFAGALFRAAASQQRALRLKHAMLDHGSTNVTQVACGSFHTLFVTHQQHVLSMGYNQAGQLGLGHRLQQLKGWRSCTPAMVETLRDNCILDIAAGQNHSACVLSNGDVFVWGCGGDGRLGVPLGQGATGEAAARQSQSECEVLPVPVMSLKDISVKARLVRCGGRHTAILSDRDLLYVWGANEFGQLGLGDKRARARPCLVQFPPFLNDGVVDVSLGEFHSACVTWNGDAYVWGLDLSGEQSTRLDQRCAPELVSLPGTESAIRVACGWAHTSVVTQASREGADSSHDVSEKKAIGTGTHKAPVHVHRRKEKALQYATRQQEVAKWRRVSTAVSLMGRLQRRMTVWRQNKVKKPKSGSTAPPKKLSLAQVVKSAVNRSKRNLLLEQERERRDRIKAVAQSFVQVLIEEAIKRAVVIITEKIAKKRAKRKRRPASTPGRRAKATTPSEPQGVFYHSALQLLPQPSLPPPWLVPPASSPRHAMVTTPDSSQTDDDCPWSLTPKPPASRSRPSRPASATASPRSVRSPRSHQHPSAETTATLSLTPSCASLLSALHEDNPREQDEEELRSPVPPTPRGSKRLNAVESLLHKPSFSLASHLTGGSNRGPRPVRPRHTCQ